MTIMLKRHVLLAAVALVATPTVALGQNDVQAQVNKVAKEAKDLEQASNTLDASIANTNDDASRAATDRDRRHSDDDDTGKWGLLGLLGLAGLLGLKRRDHHHDHVDPRDNMNPPGTRSRSGTRL